MAKYKDGNPGKRLNKILLKFQRPLFTTAKSPMMLVYEESRKFMQEVPIPELYHGYFDRHGEKFYAKAVIMNGEVSVDEADILPQSQWPKW